MRLTVIGCSPAWPNPGAAHAGYLVDGEGSLLLDCGPGVLAKLRGVGGWPRVDAIAITHFHLDHFGDLVPWVWGSLHTNGTDRPELYVPRGGRERLAAFGEQLGKSSMFDDTFRISEFSEGEPFSAAGFRVTPTRVLHYDEDAFGFTVETGSKRLAYSGDTGPCEALAELARDADLFLCEATLSDRSEDHDSRGHLALDEAVAAFEASGAHRLLVTHRPTELGGGSCEVAYEGLVVEL